MTFEWTELAYQDAISGNTMLLIFPLCVLLVYGVLAAQYESWSLPLIGHPDRADDAAVGDRRRLADRRRQQRLHADQLSRARRAGLQERHPDRRVRAAARARGRAAAHGDPRRLPHPAAAGADDVGRVHHGRRAAGAGERARRRGAAGDGHRRVRRHARRHAVRPVPDAGLLRRRAGRGGAPVAAAPPRSCAPRRPRPRRVIDRAHSTVHSLCGMAPLLVAVSPCRPRVRAAHHAAGRSVQASALQRWDAAAFSEQAYRPALVAPARGSGPRGARERRARGQSRRPLGARAVRSGARGVRRRPPAALPDRDGRAPSSTCASRASPASATSRSRINTYRAASTRRGSWISSAACGRRSRRRRPTPRASKPRSRACASASRRTSRATTSSCAASSSSCRSSIAASPTSARRCG